MSERASSEGHSIGRLAARRRQSRRRGLIIFCVITIFVLSAFVYGAWQAPVRIGRVVMYGADQSLSSIATGAMQGKYLGIIPRDSSFFLPEARIRSGIMTADPTVAAVSFFRNGLTGLSIKVDYRAPVARWCGASAEGATSSPRSNLGADCYLFDANGFVYASTTDQGQPVNSFAVYEPLADVTTPIGSTLPNAEKFPATFDFARQLATFGSPVSAVVFHDDEVDDYLASGSRVTYVLGEEQNAFTALASARANFNLADGSVDYIDLRFPGKVYLKKK